MGVRRTEYKNTIDRERNDWCSRYDIMSEPLGENRELSLDAKVIFNRKSKRGYCDLIVCDSFVLDRYKTEKNDVDKR